MSSFDRYRYKFSSKEPLMLVGDEILKERENQIIKMQDELLTYNVIIKDLVIDGPSVDIRNQILNVALYIVNDVECYEEVTTGRDLSINKITKTITMPRDFFELWRDYILAYVVILGNPNYKYIQDYLRTEESVDILSAKELILEKSKTLFKGMVLLKSKTKAIILTSKGEFKKVKISEPVYVGEEISGEGKKGLKNYKLHISIIALLIFSLIAIFGIKYTTVSKTIVISSTSSIKVEINSFNKIIDAQSPTTKGEEMLQLLDVQDEYMDESIYKIFKYIFENDMIPNGDILITVSGEMMDLEELQKTIKFLEDEKIKVKLNNSGSEHYINQ
ncbi:MAG: anti-sigma factor domain-containing protein [Clostridium sp.]